MYAKGPNRAELAAFGLTPEDVATDPVAPWPDNLTVVELFDAIRSQWRVGMNGATGLDYNVLPEMWRLFGVRKADRLQVFSDLRVMESAAIGAMNAE